MFLLGADQWIKTNSEWIKSTDQHIVSFPDPTNPSADRARYWRSALGLFGSGNETNQHILSRSKEAWQRFCPLNPCKSRNQELQKRTIHRSRFLIPVANASTGDMHVTNPFHYTLTSLVRGCASTSGERSRCTEWTPGTPQTATPPTRLLCTIKGDQASSDFSTGLT